MSTIKDRMLNLFMDNVTSDITPGDMRTLITNVFDSQENVIRKITDISVMYFSAYPILENDLVVINEEDNVNSVNGLYLATKDSPTFDDLDLINYDLNTDSILTSGGNNEILATIDGELAWIPQRTGYYLKGTKPIYDILNIVPLNLGEVFIAEDTQAGAEVPGEIGDGYSWTGSEWINIGPLKGADGVVGRDGVDGVDGSDANVTGLELITEGTNTGWRLVGRDPAVYNDIGEGAIDFTYMDPLENTTLGGASGPYSFAEGKGCVASNMTSHAEGYYTYATGYGSHAEGSGTQASNYFAHAEGFFTYATGVYSHAEGNGTTAAGDNSHAEGSTTIALNYSSHAAGKYNVGTATDTIHETGIGIGPNDRANALEIYTDGRVHVPSLTPALITDAKSLITKEYLEANSGGGGGSLIEVDTGAGLPGWTLQCRIDNVSGAYGPLGRGAVDFSAAPFGTNVGALGIHSFAVGRMSTASGNESFAEGHQTEAQGNASHAEGYSTEAIGNASHAEGETTTASGWTSHAEGYGTTASGNVSHAEGYGTTASGGYGSHAEGYYATASGYGSHAGGNYTHAEGYAAFVHGQSSYATGEYSVAFGVNAYATGDQTLAIGNYSHAIGERSIALGDDAWANGVNSVSLGSHTTANAEHSLATGLETFSEGHAGYAAGIGTIVDSSGGTAFGNRSMVIPEESYSRIVSYEDQNSTGDDITVVDGSKYSVDDIVIVPMERDQTTWIEYFNKKLTVTGVTGNVISLPNWRSSANESVRISAPLYIMGKSQTSQFASGAGFASGMNTVASGDFATAGGYQTTASGTASHAEGYHTTAIGYYSHAEGDNTTASGDDGSHAEGYSTTASGPASHAEGYVTTASGPASHAEGYESVASGYASHAEGFVNTASGDWSHAGGTNSYATAASSFASGNNAWATGPQSFAANGWTTASGNGSSAFGTYTIALNYSSHAAGKYNVGTSLDTIHETGIGTNTNARANAFEIYTDGTLTAPEATDAEITSRGSQAIPTVSWVQNNAGGGASELEKVTDVNTGWRLLGKDPLNYGNIGNNAVDLSNSSSASSTRGATGYASFASGYYTTASDWGSNASGLYSTASGWGAHAEGYQTLAIGNQSHAEGDNTQANGWNSHAEGDLTEANGSTAHAEGYRTTATANNSHAEGYSTTAEGYNSHAEGYHTVAFGYASHAEGRHNKAGGDSWRWSPHSEGWGTYAFNSGSHAEGFYTTAIGYYSHASGMQNGVASTGGFAGGQYSVSADSYSSAKVIAQPAGDQITFEPGIANNLVKIGMVIWSIQEASTDGFSVEPAEVMSYVGDTATLDRNIGFGTSVIANQVPNKAYVVFESQVSTGNVESYPSFVFGKNSLTTHQGATAFGEGIVTSTKNGLNFGQYNDIKTDTIHEIGIGADEATRANAFEIYTDGTLTAPESTDINIAARGDKALVTKEYAVVSDIAQAGAGAIKVPNMVKITQANYDLLTPDADTFYIII